MTIPLIADMHVDQGDYRVSDLIGWQRDGTLELRPHFQRGSVWKERDKSFLIDSLIRGFPIPLIVLQQEERNGPADVIRRVVDGQQRLRTIISFVDRSLLPDAAAADVWKYRPKDAGPRPPSFAFQDLPVDAQSRIMRTRIAVATIDVGASQSQVLEVYDRLNSTGSPLTAQELRYARRQGAFSDLCYRLARRNQSRWTDWKLFADNDIARMKEVEFASELLLLLKDGIAKTGRVEIDNAYDDFAAEVPGETDLERRFTICMDRLDRALAFPVKPDPLKYFRSRGWFYALFFWVDGNLERAEFLPRLLPEAARKIELDRKRNPELIRAVTGSASDRASRESRYRYLSDALSPV